MFEIRTDLAAELRDEAMSNYAKKSHGKPDGVIERERDRGAGITVCEIEITNESGASLIGKPIGKYITVSFPTARDIDFAAMCATANAVAAELSHLTETLDTKPQSLLFCGLGNRLLSADAIGPFAADKLLVTRHLKRSDSALYEKTGLFDVCAIVPGVTAQTGMEAHEIIQSTVSAEKPDLLLVCDALAARETNRLARTVQISNTGICPGSGIGGSHREISLATVGVPVFSIGVPTVVDTGTLVYDALSEAGADESVISGAIGKLNGLFVSPKEIDVISKKSRHTHRLCRQPRLSRKYFI